MIFKIRYIYLFFAIIIFSLNLPAQDPEIDSLKIALKNSKHDKVTCNILSQLAELADDDEWPEFNNQLLLLAEKNSKANENSESKKFYLNHLANALNNKAILFQNDQDSKMALFYFNKSLIVFKEVNDTLGIANTLSNIGVLYSFGGNGKLAVQYYSKALFFYKNKNDKISVANTLNSIGTVYKDIGNITQAINFAYQALKIQEEAKNNLGIANSFNIIAGLHAMEGNAEKALSLYFKILKLNEDLNNMPDIASALHNISTSYIVLNDDKKAIEYCEKSLAINKKINKNSGIAGDLINLGFIYKKRNNLDKALEYYLESLAIYENLNSKENMSFSLSYISDVLMQMEKPEQAFPFALRNFKLAKELGYPKNINNAAYILKRIYKQKGNFKEALEMYELEIQMQDSISNIETRSTNIKKQFQYQYEKQAAADSLKHAEEQKVKNALLIAQQAQLKQEKTKSIALYGGLTLLLVFAGFMVNRFRITNKQKQIIELKEIETQKQNSVITHQKHLVEEKHREITDSINYAERIQRSFLATKAQLDEHLKDYFVLFQPKDVVSGDFYWSHQLQNGNFALVTADSTGHGVPGAIMSLLNTSSLEKAVELGINEPAEILNHTRQTIIERLKKDGSSEGGKDGMDCSLISFNKDKTKIIYAAANNPIWIIREGQIIELSPDKIPVGKHDRDYISFIQHEVELQKGDMIYTLTDGFPDQFGGPNGKKFMYKRLKEMLIAISGKSVHEQETLLKDNLSDWMVNTEQVDDITILGVRI